MDKIKEISFIGQKNKFPITLNIKSRSEPDKLPYVVTIYDEYGTAQCTCKGWQYRHECFHCKEGRKQALGFSDSKPLIDKVSKSSQQQFEDLIK